MPQINIGDIVTINRLCNISAIRGDKAEILQVNKAICEVRLITGNHAGVTLSLQTDYLHLDIDDNKEINDMPVFYQIEDKEYGRKEACIVRHKDKIYCFIQVQEKDVKKIKLRVTGQFRKIEKLTIPPEWINVKIKDCEKSCELFPGNRKLREAIVGKKFPVFDFIEQYLCRVDDVKRDCYIIKTDLDGNPSLHGKALKFIASEVEILYPNPKGYNLKKDRVIKIGSMVRCINNREYIRSNKIRVKKKEIFTVKKIEINKPCPQRTILVLEDSYGNIHQAYKQYFKVL